MLKTPPLQTASATIDTLSARLQSATLLEDRRAAILGLRSFAKQYPASVASGSLRELISTLRRDGLGQQTESSQDGSTQTEGGDVDTIRLVLETLLMLFNPDSSSPEASDEVNYFMADGFSMRQDPISLLLSLLDPTSNFADYYTRLYSLQLLTAICLPRPERLQECILSAPLGVSRLVGVLDDSKDAVRNAGLLLLVDLTSGGVGAANEDLKKIIAFEDVFGRIFALIRSEGGMAEAGITALDCLSLLANLVKSSPSNQTMFRESGCVPQLTSLLRECFPPSPLTSEAGYVAQAREKAAWGLLQLLALFLEPGETGTAQNQLAFFRAGTGQLLIELAFTPELPAPIRSLALRSAAALIASNPPLQEAFAALTIAAPEPPIDAKSLPLLQVNGARSGASSAKNSARPSVEGARVYIIEALLDLTLSKPLEDPGLRAAGCGLIQAYLAGHDRIKLHFLQRAIVGHSEHETAANALNSLLHPEGGDAASVVFASWIVEDLIAENMEGKSVLAAVKEGGEEEGEDEVSFIQVCGGLLQAALSRQDERVVAAYAPLLTLLLWDFADGVNDLLAEGSGLVQALVTAASSTAEGPIIAGLATMLLGTVYEFSSKDSGVPRRVLAPLLTQKLGRGRYLNALMGLRRDPAVRDFELEDGGVEAVLGGRFVEFFMLEFSRLRKAVDKDPGIEVLPFADAEEGVDRDLLDELRQQVQTAKEALGVAQLEVVGERQQREQERMQAGKELQTVGAEVERLGRINRAIQQGHENEVEGLEKKYEEVRVGLVDEHQRALEAARLEAQRTLDERLREQGAAAAQRVQEYERRVVEMGNAHRDVQGKQGEAVRQLEAITAQHSQLREREGEVRRQFEELTQRHERVAREHAQVQSQLGEAKAELERVQAESETRGGRVTELEKTVEELREDLKGKEEELATERAGFGELERELESTKAALAAARSEVSAAPSAADSETVDKLGKQLHEAREAEKAAKEELDGMLLLMGDIEAKRDGYRDRLKELGGEVTEDEEDEDEEDEEDEE
ncbi:Vesicle-mediated ER to Golgi transport protein [Elasticomyces elasticus]|nr:Vesicle-mediated ER to Golgi transport protein [Elasticomyces elasticus]KAK3652080.1 Vesicle-mediated ER to Golgi transport protein [Elasticomyces elasticus]KAK4917828.1 Vesicle-mediated ER to Golgi transport protein [Elasticomyces elasticus]KAK5750500.1 Vesicle-mediated ER to Golgi transport protein [Elasticomyces elasticus]